MSNPKSVIVLKKIQTIHSSHAKYKWKNLKMANDQYIINSDEIATLLSLSLFLHMWKKLVIFWCFIFLPEILKKNE
jgi:hypothetical protein